MTKRWSLCFAFCGCKEVVAGFCPHTIDWGWKLEAPQPWESPAAEGGGLGGEVGSRTTMLDPFSNAKDSIRGTAASLMGKERTWKDEVGDMCPSLTFTQARQQTDRPFCTASRSDQRPWPVRMTTVTATSGEEGLSRKTGIASWLASHQLHGVGAGSSQGMADQSQKPGEASQITEEEGLKSNCFKTGEGNKKIFKCDTCQKGSNTNAPEDETAGIQVKLANLLRELEEEKRINDERERARVAELLRVEEELARKAALVEQ